MFELSPMGSGSAGALSDGARRVSYAELAAVFDELRGRFSAAGVAPDQLVGVPCENDLACTVLVLFMLYEGRACLLFPAARAAVLPPYCTVLASLDPAWAPRLAERSGARRVGDGSRAAKPGGFCLMTSGSTGRPKIVMHSHEGLVANARACVARFGLVPADRVSVPVPIFHMYGLGAALIPAVLAGASIDVQERSNVMRFVARERAFDPSVVFLTPTICHQLLATRREGRAYRLTVVAGDRFVEPAFRQYEERFGTAVALYGSTELGAVAAGDAADPIDVRCTTVGRALDGVELAAEPGTGDPVELRVRHASPYAGYLDDEGSLVPAAATEGWHATRDLAKLQSGGRLVLFGRADHAVKRDGVLVFLADVEARLAELPGVARAAVVSGDPTVRGAALVACLAAAQGAELDEAALRRGARELLPGHAVPDRFVILPELPLLATGKPDRESLRSAHARRGQ